MGSLCVLKVSPGGPGGRETPDHHQHIALSGSSFVGIESNCRMPWLLHLIRAGMPSREVAQHPSVIKHTTIKQEILCLLFTLYHQHLSYECILLHTSQDERFPSQRFVMRLFICNKRGQRLNDSISQRAGAPRRTTAHFRSLPSLQEASQMKRSWKGPREKLVSGAAASDG
jgi:hypothetical protein